MNNRLQSMARHRQPGLLGALLLLGVALLWPQPAASLGTRELFQQGDPGYRANIEWRTSTYGGELLYRRTLWKVYAEAGEYMLVASSAVGLPGTQGDLLIFNPGEVRGPVGLETIPPTPSFSCAQQRGTPGNATRGRIGSRDEELAGANQPGGYLPCYYQAPNTGFYDVVILGPDGINSDREIAPSGRIEATAADFTANQATAVTAWDIMVADTITATYDTDEPGRLFAYYFALLTGANGRPIYNTVYVVTQDGFRYEVTTRGTDPFGFIFYSNQVGFLDTDGTPLYRNVMAVPTLPTQRQNQLYVLQGGVRLAPPQHPIFLEEPSPATLTALGIPLEPVTPVVRDLRFTGPTGSSTTTVGAGGTFSFNLDGGSGIYSIVVSRDGVNFDPTLPENRVLYGSATTRGLVEVPWDGRDNVGNVFPSSDVYRAVMAVQGGEVHFPALDVENNLDGTTVRLINPPGGVCPPLNGGCTATFYDDRGYITASGTLVGVANNGFLCPGNVGNPPPTSFSDPIRGFDSTTNQRRWGFATGGNPPSVCDRTGGFGDKKGLDRWAYYPSNRLEAPLAIEEPTAVTLTDFAATRTPEGVLVRWTTGVELDSRGFALYRSQDGTWASATRVTPDLIPARGSPSGGATYSWPDTTAAPDVTSTYWLEELETSGARRTYGPIRVMPTVDAAGQRVYLPLLSR